MQLLIEDSVKFFQYNSFEEFVNHYEQMKEDGYEPNENSNPYSFKNHSLPIYFAEYRKRTMLKKSENL